MTNPVRAAYVTRYNDEYAKTPATLDYQIRLAARRDRRGLDTVSPAGQRVRTLLWSNGHASGAYVARTIYERFGLDSLFPAITSPVAMLAHVLGGREGARASGAVLAASVEGARCIPAKVLCR